MQHEACQALTVRAPAAEMAEVCVRRNTKGRMNSGKALCSFPREAGAFPVLESGQCHSFVPEPVGAAQVWSVC